MDDVLGLAENDAFRRIVDEEGDEFEQVGSIIATLIEGNARNRQVALALVGQALYVLEPEEWPEDEGELGDVELTLVRRFPYEDIASLVASSATGQVLLQSDTDADVLVDVDDGELVVECLVSAVDLACGRKLDVQLDQAENLLSRSRGIVKRKRVTQGGVGAPEAKRESAEERAAREKADETKRKKEREERELFATLDRFSGPRFDSVKQARRVFEEGGEEGARVWKTDIARVRQFAVARMRAQVHSNYRHFIRIARGIAALEADGASLRRALGEAQGTLRDLAGLALQPHGATAGAGDGWASETEGVQLRGELLDELDVLLAQRRIDAAITALAAARDRLEREERGAGPRLPALQRLRSEVNERAARIRTVLCDELSAAAASTGPSPSLLDKLQGQLQQLGAGEAARWAYLRGRGALSAAESGRLKMRGDAALYGPRLAEALFTTLRQTCGEFRTTFGSGRPMAGFVLWSASEVDRFVEVYRRQVFPSGNLFAIAECLHSAFANAAQLEKRGMSFTALLIARFRPGLVQALDQYGHRLEVSLASCMSQEALRAVEVLAADLPTPLLPPHHGPPAPRLRVPACRRALFAVLGRFVTDAVPLAALPVDMRDRVQFGAGALLERYSAGLHRIATASALSDSDAISVLGEVEEVVEGVLPRVAAELKAGGALDLLHSRLRTLRDTLFATFITHRSTLLAANIQWPSDVLARETVDKERAEPGEGVRLAAAALAALAEDAAAKLPPAALRQLLSGLIERLALEILAHTDEAIGGSNKHRTHSLAYGGVQQVALDVRFLAAVCSQHAGSDARATFYAALQRVVDAFCADTGQAQEKALQPEGWFRAAVQRAAMGGALRARLTSLGDLFLDWGPESGLCSTTKNPQAPMEAARSVGEAASGASGSRGTSGPRSRRISSATTRTNSQLPANELLPPLETTSVMKKTPEMVEAASRQPLRSSQQSEQVDSPPEAALSSADGHYGRLVDGSAGSSPGQPALRGTTTMDVEVNRTMRDGYKRGAWRERLAALRSTEAERDDERLKEVKTEELPLGPRHSTKGDAAHQAPEAENVLEAGQRSAQASKTRGSLPQQVEARLSPAEDTVQESSDDARRRRLRSRLSAGATAEPSNPPVGPSVVPSAEATQGSFQAARPSSVSEEAMVSRLSIRERAAARIAARAKSTLPPPSECAASSLEVGEMGEAGDTHPERLRTLRRVESLADRRTRLLGTLKERYGDGDSHPNGSGVGPGGGSKRRQS